MKIKHLMQVLIFGSLLLASGQEGIAKSNNHSEKENNLVETETNSWLGDKLGQFTNWLANTIVQAPLGAINGVQTAVADNCPKPELRGAQQVCSNYPATYELKFFRGSSEVPQQYQKINWTVGADDKILSVSGMSIGLLEQNYRTQMGLPAGFPVDITQISIDAQNLKIDYQGTLSHDLSYTYSQTKGYSAVYSGDTVVLGGNLSNTQSIYAQFAFKGAFNITASNITGADPGKSIVVSFSGEQTQSNVVVQYDKAIVGAFGCPAQSLQMPIQITRKPTIPSFVGLPTTSVSCLDQINLTANYQRDAQFAWAFEGANVSGSTINGLTGFYAGNSIYVNGFSQNGQKVVLLQAYNKCGNSYKESIVDVQYPNVSLKIDGNNFTASVLNVNCKQHEQGFNLSLSPYLPSSVKYTWTLPPGWSLSNYAGKISKTETVGGITKYTYSGTEMAYPRFTALTANGLRVATAGKVYLKLENVCSPTGVIEKSFDVTIPNQIAVSLPADAITCNNTINLSAILSPNAVTPFKSTWSASGLVGQFTASSITSNAVINSFTAQQFGEGSIRLTVTDANGCSANASAYVKMFGGIDNSGLTSGWLSGHLNPNRQKSVNSNLAVSSLNHLYFVSKNASVGEIWRYIFNETTQKWDYTYVGISNANININNNIRFVSGVGQDFLFYIGADGFLWLARLNQTNGSLVSFGKIIGDIMPTIDINGYVVKGIGSFGGFDNNVGLYYRTNTNADLTLSRINISRDIAQLELNATSTIATGNTTPGFESAIAYEFDRSRNRLYYFKTNGGFYMRNFNPLTGISPEVLLNNITDGVNVNLNTISELEYDDKENVYFTANGYVFYVSFDAQGNHLATYKIETKVGLPTAFNSGQIAKRFLAINAATNTLYYQGDKNDVFQVVRGDNFTSNPNFKIFKASPLSMSENVTGTMVYANKHLYYLSNRSTSTTTNTQIYNLFYYNVSQVATCTPTNLRTSADEQGFDLEVHQLESPNSVLTKQHTHMVFPNPASDKLSVSNLIGTGSIQVLNMNGLELLESNYSSISSEIDLSSLAKGVYLLRIQSNTSGTTEVLKIVKD